MVNANMLLPKSELFRPRHHGNQLQRDGEYSCMRFLMLGFIVLVLVDCATFGPKPGAITGQIIDPAHLGLPRVTIQATPEDASRRSFTGQTSDNGYFRVDGVSEGTYSIQATLQGFNKKLVRDVKVHSGETKKLGPVEMQLASCNTPNGPLCDEVK